MKISACCFIKNTFAGAYCCFESLANALTIADEVIIMDLGSTDGTLEELELMALSNPKIKLVHSTFKEIDAGIFATLANDLIAMCKYDTVWYYQADEIWHENLLRIMKEKLDLGIDDLSFWRVQLGENWQLMRQFPQRVDRIGKKNNFNFVGDGMNSDRYNDPQICSNFDGGWFIKWGTVFEAFPTLLPTHEMILDVSLIGAFRDNIFDRKSQHSPFWRDGLDMPYWKDGVEGRIPMEDWIEVQRLNTNWIKSSSPYQIPKIMKGLVGDLKYRLRDEVKKAIIEDKTGELIWTQ